MKVLASLLAVLLFSRLFISVFSEKGMNSHPLASHPANRFMLLTVVL